MSVQCGSSGELALDPKLDVCLGQRWSRAFLESALVPGVARCTWVALSIAFLPFPMTVSMQRG